MECGQAEGHTLAPRPKSLGQGCALLGKKIGRGSETGHLSRMKIPNVRWWIAGLLVLISANNYLDRGMLSILAPTIQGDLGLSDGQYANVLSWFLVAYTVAYVLSGRIVDAIGVRWGLTIFIGFWSLANAMTGLARSATSLSVYRFALGLGEAGGWTAGPKVIADWFPKREHGLAMGLLSVGGSLGSTIAPVLVVTVSAQYGWRSAFFITGLIGLGLMLLWAIFYREPGEHVWVRDSERQMLQTERVHAPDKATANTGSEAWRWGQILRHPAVWALVAARMLTDPVWYFFQFWLPKYLHSVRGFSQLELGSLWIIFVAADIGFLAGGFLSDRLVRQGWQSRRARLAVMLGCALLVPLAPLIALLPNNSAAFGVAMVVVLAQTAWMACINTFIIDFLPAAIFGSAYGFIAMGSAAGGIVMNQLVVRVVHSYSYAHCFYAMALLQPLAFLLLVMFANRAWERSPAS